MNSSAANITVLAEKAMYRGPAAGKYATRTITAGALSDAQAGHFTATATLTANFDADSTPAADGGDPDTDNDGIGTISGMVTGFEASDGVDASAWEVTLGTAGLSDTNGAVSAMFNGKTDVDFGGGKVKGAGTWQGAFYNDTKPAADATDDGTGDGCRYVWRRYRWCQRARRVRCNQTVAALPGTGISS